MALLLRGVKDSPKAKAYAVLRSALSEELGRHGGTLLTKSEFLAARETAGAANSYRGNIAVFGTIYLMAPIARHVSSTDPPGHTMCIVGW